MGWEELSRRSRRVELMCLRTGAHAQLNPEVQEQLCWLKRWEGRSDSVTGSLSGQDLDVLTFSVFSWGTSKWGGKDTNRLKVLEKVEDI